MPNPSNNSIKKLDKIFDNLFDHFRPASYFAGAEESIAKEKIMSLIHQQKKEAVIKEFQALLEFHDPMILPSLIKGRLAELTREVQDDGTN